MNRKALTLCLGLCLTAASAHAGAPTPDVPRVAETGSGIFLVVEHARVLGLLLSSRPEASSAGEKMLLTANRRLFIRPALAMAGAPPVEGGAVATVVAKLETCQNNLYALAVNSNGIARANTAVKVGGRVFLRAGGSGTSPVGLATKTDKTSGR